MDYLFAFLAALVGVLANVIAAWMQPSLEKWKKTTIFFFVTITSFLIYKQIVTAKVSNDETTIVADDLSKKLENCFDDFMVGNDLFFIKSKFGEPQIIDGQNMTWRFGNLIEISTLVDKKLKIVEQVKFEVPEDSDFKFKVHNLPHPKGRLWLPFKEFPAFNYEEAMIFSKIEHIGVDVFYMPYNQNYTCAIRTCHGTKHSPALHGYLFNSVYDFCDKNSLLDMPINALIVSNEDCYYDFLDEIDPYDLRWDTPLGMMIWCNDSFSCLDSLQCY